MYKGYCTSAMAYDNVTVVSPSCDGWPFSMSDLALPCGPKMMSPCTNCSVVGGCIISRGFAPAVPAVPSHWVDLPAPHHGHHQTLDNTTEAAAAAAVATDSSSKVGAVCCLALYDFMNRSKSVLWPDLQAIYHTDSAHCGSRCMGRLLYMLVLAYSHWPLTALLQKVASS